MASSDVELDKQLSEAGGKLVDPPASVDELLALLEQVESCLAKVDQSPSKYMQGILSVPLQALVGDKLFKHSDIDVRVAVASCMSEVTRISAPEAPYADDTMREVFQLIVSSFENLYDKSARSYGKRCAILETAAKVRSCVLMLDLECDAMILEMFHHFLKEIRDYHPESVFTAMETIMALVIEESEDVSPELLSSILATVKKDDEEVPPIVRKLGERVLRSCESKLKPYLSELLKSLGVSSNDYSSIVSSICDETVDGTDQNGVDLDGGQKLDESAEEVATPQQADSAADISPQSVVSNGEAKEEQDSSLADSASVKKEEHGHDSNAAEIAKLSTDEIDNLDMEDTKKTESQPEQTPKREGSNPESSPKQVESPDDSRSEEKEADSKDSVEMQDQQNELENNITPTASEKQSAEESLPSEYEKEAVVEPSSSEADGNEPLKNASPSHSQDLPEENQAKEGEVEKNKESMIIDGKAVAEEISEKISEKTSEDEVATPKEKENDLCDEKPSKTEKDTSATSDSEAKPLKQHNEEAVLSKKASKDMSEDEVETPRIKGSNVSNEKPSKTDMAIDATSDSEAKSAKQRKKESLSSSSGGGISTRKMEDKKGQDKGRSDSEAKPLSQHNEEAVHSKKASKEMSECVVETPRVKGNKVSDEKPRKDGKDTDATSDSEEKSLTLRKKEALSSSSGGGISKRQMDETKGQAEGRSDSEAKSVMQHNEEAVHSKKASKEMSEGVVETPQVKGNKVSDEKPSKDGKDTDATSDSEAKSLKQRKKDLSSSSGGGISTRKMEAKGRSDSEAKPLKQHNEEAVRSKKAPKEMSKNVVETPRVKGNKVAEEKSSKADKDIDATSDSEAKSLKQHKKEALSSSSGGVISTRKTEDKKVHAKGKIVSEKQVKTSVKKDVKVISDEKPIKADKDIDATSDSEAKSSKQRKKEALSSSSGGGVSTRQPEDKKGQAKSRMVSEKQVKASGKKDVDKVISDKKPSKADMDIDTTSDSEAKSLKQRKKEVLSSSSGGVISTRQPVDKKGQAKGGMGSEKQVKTSATKDVDKSKEVGSSSKAGKKRARDETHTDETPLDHSKKRAVLKEKTPTKKEYGEELVDTRIKVWWPLDKVFYEGKITFFDPVKKKHTVHYVDDEFEVLQLKDEKWMLASDDDSESDQEQTEDEESLSASPGRPPMKKGKTDLNSSAAKKEKIEASSKKSGSGKSKEAAPISGSKSQSSKSGEAKAALKTPKSKESEIGSSKLKQETPKTAKAKQEDDPPLPKRKTTTTESGGKPKTPNGSGKAKANSSSASKTLGTSGKKRRRD